MIDNKRGQSLEQSRTKSFPTSLNLSGETERTEVYTYELGEGSAGVVQPAMCITPVVNQAEQVILQVENPASASPPPPSSSSSHTTSAVAFTTESNRTMPSSLLNRLYTTNPFAMSTPQLSPVHETREEDVGLDLSLKYHLIFLLLCRFTKNLEMPQNCLCPIPVLMVVAVHGFIPRHPFCQQTHFCPCLQYPLLPS